MTVSDYFCVLQAVLNASGEVARPLSAETVLEIVRVVDQNNGWPSDARLDLLELIGNELDVLALVEEGNTTVAPDVPCLVFYKTEGDDSHCVFSYPPFPDAAEMHYLMILKPREEELCLTDGGESGSTSGDLMGPGS